MKGKKIDSEFLGKFIAFCIDKGLMDSEQMVIEAKNIINDIDSKIREVEILKVKRSKLLDVVVTFDKTVKDKSEDIILLPFFRLQYPQTCKEICQQIKIHGMLDCQSNNADTIFCIKQLIETKIVNRVDGYLVCGDRFNEYMTFVWQEPL
jgi:hypothetical protein